VYKIIAVAIIVHKELGPGLLESVYETCFEYDLKANGCNVKRQLVIPIKFRNLVLDANLKLDLLIDNLIVVELKAIESILIYLLPKWLTFFMSKEVSKWCF
jgi:GxxExxY protein